MKEVLVMTVVFSVVFGLSFVMINLRQIVTGKDFRGTCASNNPMLKNKLGECEVCGKTPDEDCGMPEVQKA